MEDIYCDMCIQEGGQVNEMLERLFSNRFYLVCINRDVNLSDFKSPDDKSKEARKRFRESVTKHLHRMDFSAYENSQLAKFAKVHGAKAKILSRLTIQFEDVNDIQQLCQEKSNELNNNFDVIAARPRSASAFNYSCDQMPIIDLIQLDTSDKPSFRLSHQMVRRARDRDLKFEFLLAPMLNNSASRAYTVSVAQNFVDITGGRSLVFSSGAHSVWDVRNHIGLISVATMLGVRVDLAPHCVRDTPKSVLRHALVRTRTIFGALAIEKLERQAGVKSVMCVGKVERTKEGVKEGGGDVGALSQRMRGVIDLDDDCEPAKKKRKKNKNKKGKDPC